MASYSFKLLHVSDTHLGAKPYGLIDRERDVYEVFMEVVDIAKKERVDALLHAGDMFDKSTPRPATLMVAVKGLRELAERGVRVYVSPGNHEHPKAIDEGSPVRLLEVIGLVRGPDPRSGTSPTIYREGDDGRVVLAVFPPASVSTLRGFSIAKKRGEALVLLAHARLCDALHDTEGVPLERCGSLAPLSSSDISGEVDYAALGDLHITWETRLPRGGRAVYPGATEHLAVDEYERSGGKRFVYIVRIEDGALAEARRVELKNVRPWVVLRGPYVEVLGSIESFRRAGGKPPLLYVEVSDPIDKVKRDRLVSRLKSLVLSGEVLDYVLHARTHTGAPPARLPSSGQRLDLSRVVAELVKQLVKKHAVREDCPGVDEFVEKLGDFVLQPSDDKAKSLLKTLESTLASCR